jgi:hypothetical protein
MPYALRSLGRNLLAGLRLAFFLPVSRLDFRIDAVQLLLLFAVSCAIDIAGDRLRYGADAAFMPTGLGGELSALALMAITALVVALALRRPVLALALTVVELAAMPAVQVLHFAPFALTEVAPAASRVLLAADYLVLAWLVAILVRAVALYVDAPARRRWTLAGVGGLVLALPLALSPLLVEDSAWYRVAGAEDQGDVSAASEPVLAAQRLLLDDALSALADHESGGANLYFVAYAPDGSESAWNDHVDAVQRVMDERFDTAGRSVVLRNHPETLLSEPFATVTNLRETLDEIGAAADPAEDVVMVYIGGRGVAGGAVPGVLPPLDLVPLTPALLKRLLDDAGLRWRVIIVAACYAGAYAAVLEDEQTAVVAASAADRPSFGCEGRGEPTFFGDALFTEGLARSPSLPAAFAVARSRVAERERTRGLTPSNPVLQVGTQIAPKLKALRSRGGGGATARLDRRLPAPA